jgi:hypothetical protein
MISAGRGRRATGYRVAYNSAAKRLQNMPVLDVLVAALGEGGQREPCQVYKLMTYLDDPALPQLRVGTGWTEVVVRSEIGVRFTQRGYAPCVVVERGSFPHVLFVSALSLGKALEAMRQERGGTLIGARFRLRKTSAERTAPYEVESAECSCS